MPNPPAARQLCGRARVAHHLSSLDFEPIRHTPIDFNCFCLLFRRMQLSHGWVATLAIPDPVVAVSQPVFQIRILNLHFKNTQFKLSFQNCISKKQFNSAFQNYISNLHFKIACQPAF